MIGSKQVLVGAGMVIGLGLWAGTALAFDDKDSDTLGVPVTADELSDERAGNLLIGVNEATQEQTIGDGDVTVNAGNVTLGNNNRSFASAYAINTGANAQVLAQNIVILNLNTVAAPE